MAQGPPAGTRVLELSQIIAAPFAGMLLADIGAARRRSGSVNGRYSPAGTRP